MKYATTIKAARKLALAGALFAAMLFIIPTEVLACGGCFSPPPPPGRQNNQLILQDAERVFFHHDPKTGKTLVWVEVKYSGLAENFGWVLPLPSQPKVGVGSSWIFNQLDQRHAPRFTTRVSDSDENCRDWDDWCFGPDPQPVSGNQSFADAGATAPGSDSGAGEAKDDDGEVKILAQDKAGPYDYVVIAGSDPAKLLKWLNDKGFETPKAALPVIKSHVEKGDVFVGFKLQNNAGVKEIRPVVLEMEDGDPCVPLRLTAIAAVDNMSVVATIAGHGRAIPKNNMHVKLNLMKLNWFNNANNYAQVMAEAIDEAAGRAFVTEYAGDAKDTVLLNKNNRMNSKVFETVTNAAELGKAIISSKLLLNDDSANTIERVTGMAKAAGQTPLQYYSQLRSCGYGNYRSGYCFKRNRDNGTVPVDGPAVAKGLEKDFIAPIHALVDAVGDSKKLTRLVMRISPDEMDRDPIFAYNPALPDVANKIEATFRKVCSTGWYPYDMVRLVVPGFGSWIFDGKLPGETSGGAKPGNNAIDDRFIKSPFAHSVQLLDETGAPTIVHESQIDLVDGIIQGAVTGKPSIPKDTVLKEGEPRWKIPEDDDKRTFVQKRDDSKCTVFHAIKPWQTAEEVVTQETRVDNGEMGCTAGFGGSGGAFGGLLMLALACFGALGLRRRLA